MTPIELQYVIYPIWLVVAFILIRLYFLVAVRFSIIDKPNERSSHIVPIIRGGGIIIPISVLFWYFSFGFQNSYFVLGLLLVSTISFIDDIKNLPSGLRVVIHLISVSFLFADLDLMQLPWYLLIPAYILMIGWVNAFNFMDGINGISSLYAIVCIFSIVGVEYLLGGFDFRLFGFVLIALGIFTFYNLRKRARCFAGDVGSVALAFTIAFLIIPLLQLNWAYLGLVLVYGIDTSLTIFHRIMKGEKITEAHRTHNYQYLANELGWSHIKTSVFYAVLQLLVSGWTIFGITMTNSPSWLIFLVPSTILALAYIGGRIWMLNYIEKKL